MSVDVGILIKNLLNFGEREIKNKTNSLNPIEESRILAEFVGIDLSSTYTSNDLLNRYKQSLSERTINRRPLAYITGYINFCGHKFDIDERVLWPRPETETLVKTIIDIAPQNKTVLDVGTGSGAIAISIAIARQDLKVFANDISDDALQVAIKNGNLLGGHVKGFYNGDLLKDSTANIIVADLPYLPKRQKDSYSREMVDYEPDIALWGGDDGYDLIRRLLDEAFKDSNVEMVALEVGKGQSEDVSELMKEAGFTHMTAFADTLGDERVVVAKL